MTIDEKRGKFISELREEKNLTQEEFGNLLHYDNTTISKWERGKSFPADPNVIQKIAETLDITIEELLYGEKKDKNNKDEMQENFINEYTNNYKKYKKRLNMSIYVILVSIIVFFITIYFVFIRSTISVYSINLEDDNIRIENSTLIISNYISILNFNKITERNDKKIDNVKLYYLTDSDEERLVFSGENKNHYIEEQNGYEEYNLEELPNVRLFVEVLFDDGDRRNYQLCLEKKYTNNNIFPKKVEKISEETTMEDLDINKEEAEKRLLAEGFKYTGSSYDKELKDESLFSVDIEYGYNIDYFSAAYILSSRIYNEEILYLPFGSDDYSVLENIEPINCNEKKCKSPEDIAGYIKYIKNLLKLDSK